MKYKLVLNDTITYLKKNYNLDVYLLNNKVWLSEQVAQWENNIIAIDVSKRWILGTLFILSHVFWHLIQYSTTNKYEKMLNIVNSRPLPLKLDNVFKSKYFNYEMEAFKIWKWLLENFIKFDINLNKKFISFMYTDFEHFWNFLITWKKNPIENFNELWSENYLKCVDNKLDSIDAPLIVEFSKARQVKITVV